MKFFFSFLIFLAAMNVSHAQQFQVDGWILRYQINSALCQTHHSKNSLKQCKNGMILSIIGLQPEANGQKPVVSSQKEMSISKQNLSQIGRVRCVNRSSELPPLQAKVMGRWMPDKTLRQQSWQVYGACAGLTSQKYFRKIDKLASKLQIPDRITNGKASKVSKVQLKNEMLTKNPSMKKQSIRFACKKNKKFNSYVLSELQVCYDTIGKYSNCVQSMNNKCPSSFVILGF